MEIRYYDEQLGIDGTCDELVNWSWQYSTDYSDAALLQIYEIAVKENNPKKLLPLLELKRRSRAEDELPYEQIVASAIYYGDKPSYSKSTDYGELEIFTDMDNVIISISGTDDGGCFHALNSVELELFMSNVILEPQLLE
jgi:hypothetical protein